jgi:hypothetical protein
MWERYDTGELQMDENQCSTVYNTKPTASVINTCINIEDRV